MVTPFEFFIIGFKCFQNKKYKQRPCFAAVLVDEHGACYVPWWMAFDTEQAAKLAAGAKFVNVVQGLYISKDVSLAAVEHHDLAKAIERLCLMAMSTSSGNGKYKCGHIFSFSSNSYETVDT